MSGLTSCPAECMRFSWQMGPEPLGQEHFLGQGGHYPCEMPLDDLTVGEPFFQWRCHLSPSELPVVAVGSALWSDTNQTYPFVHLSVACGHHCASLESAPVQPKCPHFCLFIRPGAQTLAILFCVPPAKASLSIPRKKCEACNDVLVTRA